MDFEFIPIDRKKPPYGAPVLLKIGSMIQHITYMLDGADDTEDWFEPYHFDHDDELKISSWKIDGWALMPDWNG